MRILIVLSGIRASPLFIVSSWCSRMWISTGVPTIRCHYLFQLQLQNATIYLTTSEHPLQCCFWIRYNHHSLCRLHLTLPSTERCASTVVHWYSIRWKQESLISWLHFDRVFNWFPARAFAHSSSFQLKTIQTRQSRLRAQWSSYEPHNILIHNVPMR